MGLHPTASLQRADYMYKAEEKHLPEFISKVYDPPESGNGILSVHPIDCHCSKTRNYTECNLILI